MSPACLSETAFFFFHYLKHAMVAHEWRQHSIVSSRIRAPNNVVSLLRGPTTPQGQRTGLFGFGELPFVLSSILATIA